jgi:hypothetical protein
MNIVIDLGMALMLLAALLFGGVLFFSFLKYLKRTRYPNWKFPDYISVGYAEYLYNKYIRRKSRKS